LAHLSIPEKHRAALTKVRTLREGVAEQLANALNAVAPSAKKSDVVQAISPQVPAVQVSDLEAILSMLYSLYQARAYSDVPLAEFISDLCCTMDSDRSDELRLGPDRNLFQDRMRVLLSVEPLNVFAKAYTLQREQQHVFCDARILTDLRPVFGPETDDPPLGAFVGHTLKIVYHSGSGHHELYLALDTEDLAKLRALIERANSKAKTLSKLMETKGIQNLVS
jgi:hypothetical protein